MAAVVELTNVTKEYSLTGGHLRVLDHLSLRIEKGETVALVGASGSGKSTLLALVAGLDRPTSGSVVTVGVDLVRTRPSKLAAFRFAHIGLVFQQYHLIPTLTALENVELPCAPWRTDYRPRQRAQELLAAVGLGDRMQHLPGQLSGGEQQRVCIARALINRPSLLLADEPTGNLDESAAAEVMRLLRSLSSQGGTTLLMVTHDRALAATFDRVMRMNQGSLSETST